MFDCCITDTMYSSDFFPLNRQEACFVLFDLFTPKYTKATFKTTHTHKTQTLTHTREHWFGCRPVCVCECIVQQKTERRRCIYYKPPYAAVYILYVKEREGETDRKRGEAAVTRTTVDLYFRFLPFYVFLRSDCSLKKSISLKRHSWPLFMIYYWGFLLVQQLPNKPGTEFINVKKSYLKWDVCMRTTTSIWHVPDKCISQNLFEQSNFSAHTIKFVQLSLKNLWIMSKCIC